MSDSEKRSTSDANVLDSSKDLSTTPEENSSSEVTSQALPVMSESLPEDPFSQITPIRKLEDETASATPQEESTDDLHMFTDFPINQVLAAVFSESSDEEHPPVNLRTPRRKLEENVTASQENMPDIVGPLKLDRPSKIFLCSFMPARYLKFAIEVLSNPEVSSKGSGRIDVAHNGFNISVENSSNYVLGHLHLKPAMFQCTKPVYGKKFNFLPLSQGLVGVLDEGPVHLSNSSGTDQLDISAMLEGNTGDSRSFSVELSYNSAEIRKFPDMSLFFTATVPSDDFNLMIHHLQQTPQVSVDIKNNTATLRVENDNSWTADYALLRADGSRATEAEENYSASFEWTNTSVAESLQKAIVLDAELVVLFHEERPKSIILRFILEDVGYLEFIRECSKTVSSTRS